MTCPRCGSSGRGSTARRATPEGECKGYLRGGYKRIIDTLAAKLRTKGVLIQTDTAIESIEPR